MFRLLWASSAVCRMGLRGFRAGDQKKMYVCGIVLLRRIVLHKKGRQRLQRRFQPSHLPSHHRHRLLRHLLP